MVEHLSISAKRVFDLIGATSALIVAAPLLLVALVAVVLQDGHSPIYPARRVGRGGAVFKCYKLRSMVVGADRAGIDTAPTDDSRITRVGRILRQTKIDELPQLINVLRGEMSLVGPRPQIEREAALYTGVERGLLAVKPGMTDFASIVFADLNEIVRGSADPNIAYEQLVRPWKSRLGLFYIKHNSFRLDVVLVATTVVALVHRRSALDLVERALRRLGASSDLIRVSGRRVVLEPVAPPGSSDIITTRSPPTVRAV